MVRFFQVTATAYAKYLCSVPIAVEILKNGCAWKRFCIVIIDDAPTYFPRAFPDFTVPEKTNQVDAWSIWCLLM